jgi:hypothetical protein
MGWFLFRELFLGNEFLEENQVIMLLALTAGPE